MIMAGETTGAPKKPAAMGQRTKLDRTGEIEAGVVAGASLIRCTCLEFFVIFRSCSSIPIGLIGVSAQTIVFLQELSTKKRSFVCHNGRKAMKRPAELNQADNSY